MFNNTPQVVKQLIIINVLFYLGTMVVGEEVAIPMLAGTYPGSPFFRPWQIITHMFMHGGLTHIFFNMYALYMFGSQLERVWGGQRFLKYYIISGLGGFFLHEVVVGWEIYLQYGTFFPSWEEIVQPGWSEPMAYRYTENLFGRVVGASGAVFGVLLAFGMLFPNTQLFLLFPPIPIKAKYFVLFYGLLELGLGLQAGLGSQIAHFAHLGGMLFGFLLLPSWQRDRGTFY